MRIEDRLKDKNMAPAVKRQAMLFHVQVGLNVFAFSRINGSAPEQQAVRMRAQHWEKTNGKS